MLQAMLVDVSVAVFWLNRGNIDVCGRPRMLQAWLDRCCNEFFPGWFVVIPLRNLSRMFWGIATWFFFSECYNNDLRCCMVYMRCVSNQWLLMLQWLPKMFLSDNLWSYSSLTKASHQCPRFAASDQLAQHESKTKLNMFCLCGMYASPPLSVEDNFSTCVTYIQWLPVFCSAHGWLGYTNHSTNRC